MSGTHNARPNLTSSPPHVRKAVIKATRSVPLSKTAATPNIIIKPAKTTKKPKQEDEELFEDDEDDMGSTFLQYCAMCDRQIVVPSSSILYCSENCRRRDAALPTISPELNLMLESPHKMHTCYDQMDPFGSKIPTYVPALNPTPRTAPDGRIPAKYHDGKSDLDPTEWKPAETNINKGKSPTRSGEWKPKLVHHPSSEASSFLGKFHRSSDALSSRRRPMIGHGRTTVSSRSTPALSHTPASTSSEESLSGTPYEFVARPALSVPTTTTTSTTKPVGSMKDGNDLTYEKKSVGVSLGSAKGSLKKLLGTPGGT